MNEDPTNPNDVSRLTNDEAPRGKMNILIGRGAGKGLTRESCRFCISVPDGEYQGSITPAEYNMLEVIVRRLKFTGHIETEAEIMRPKQFKEGCFGFRSDIELLKKQVKNWMRHPVFDDLPPKADPMEMKANLTLVYRALEDARMRVGKAIQAFDGGKSVNPR